MHPNTNELYVPKFSVCRVQLTGDVEADVAARVEVALKGEFGERDRFNPSRTHL